MHIITTPNGIKGSIPEGLHEVPLSKYIKFEQESAKRLPPVLAAYMRASSAYYEQIEAELTHASNKGRTRAQIEAGVSRLEIDAAINERDKPENAIAVLEYEAWCLSFWSGIPLVELMGYADSKGMILSQLKALYVMLMNRLCPPDSMEYSNVIEHDGGLWYLPAKYMEDGTVGEYLEACEFQNQASKLSQGQWAAMANIMCILVRKEGEHYHKGLMDRHKMFLEWPMSKVWEVAFFLTTRIERLSLASLTYIKAQQLAHLKQELRHLTQSTETI